MQLFSVDQCAGTGGTGDIVFAGCSDDDTYHCIGFKAPVKGPGEVCSSAGVESRLSSLNFPSTAHSSPRFTLSRFCVATMAAVNEKAHLEPDSHEVSGISLPASEKSRSPTPEVTPSAAASSPRQMSQISWILVLISILSAVFLFALDNTVVADIQPKVINQFGEIEKLPWASVAFALGAVAVNLFW